MQQQPTIPTASPAACGVCVAPASRRCQASAPAWLVSPLALILLTLGIHVAGRIVALNGPSRVDSFTYCINAYKLYQPHTAVTELVADKPAGQAFLTGWCYLLWPGPPSRLTLVPVESAFMLGGYLVFGLLAARYFGASLAAALTLFAAIGLEIYNALDPTTDGFNLNENYLALPVLLAVYAHLRISRPVGRGLVQGLALGVALTIKQTAVAPLAALLAHEGWRWLAGRTRARVAVTSAAYTLPGLVLGVLPLALFLHHRGWVVEHARIVLTHSGQHLRWMQQGIIPMELRPLLPLLWWMGLGLLVAAAEWWCGRQAVSAAGSGQCGVLGSPDGEDESGSRREVLVFACVWLLAEMVMVWLMYKTSSHYFQQVVPPLALLAGCGMARLGRSARSWPEPVRTAAWRWVGVTAAALAVVAATMLLPEAHKRARGLSRAAEVRMFQQYLASWPWHAFPK